MSEIVIDGEVITWPRCLVENPSLLKEVLTMDVWETLSDEHRKCLSETLPEFLTEDDRTETVRLLLTGDDLSQFPELNTGSGNPLSMFVDKLNDGYFTPNAYRLRKSYKRAIKAKSMLSKHQYYHQLLKNIVVSRQCHLAVHQSPHSLKLSKPHQHQEPTEPPLKLGRKSKEIYQKILREIKTNILSNSTFTTEDLLSSDNEDDDVIEESNRDQYFEMLIRHKLRRTSLDICPDMSTNGIKLSEVYSRTFNSNKKLPRIGLLGKRKKWEGGLKLATQKRIKKSIQTISAKRRKPIEGRFELCTKQDVSNKTRTKTMPACFFELIRDVIKLSTDKTLTSVKQLVADWSVSSEASRYHWTTKRPDWSKSVESALQFMACPHNDRDETKNFHPVVIESNGSWRLIPFTNGNARKILSNMCRVWMNEEIGSSFDDLSFHSQERHRYKTPHRAYVYTINGKRYVVPPVKGSSGLIKQGRTAREHCLLKSERPHQVTLLALTRDAVARMDGGSGTRNDVCNLVRESQYLTDVVSDAQINAAVSGALDRLHYEDDPCVKFDASKRAWLYLHSARSIQELERVHAKQLLAPKKKKIREKFHKKSLKVPEKVGRVEGQLKQEVGAKTETFGPRTIQLTQKQLIEITKKLSQQQGSEARQNEGQPSLKLILKSSNFDQKPSVEFSRDEASPSNQHRPQVLTPAALKQLSEHLSAVSSRPIKIVHQPHPQQPHPPPHPQQPHP
ncbi:nuclear factor related to kappa-B-binding protein [Ciona intestinalis]